ncbi:hypothetical protein DRQ12_06475 [candidate division KSB1 bacterium]|nr:MAG: hypothetical protein DRQ12_06475 [candidate division KSB1 bacterium]
MESSTQLAEGVKEKTFFARWFGVYFSPRETFESIKRKPDWLIPLVAWALISAFSIVIISPVLKTVQINTIAEKRGISEEEAEELLQSTAGVQKIAVPLSSFVSVFVVTLIVAGIFFMVGNYFMGGDTSYKKVLSVYCYTTFSVGFVGAIIKVPLILAKKSMAIQTSLAVILSEDARETFLYRLFSHFDIFTIWTLILMVIGMSVIYNFSTKKSVTFVGSLWVLWIVISLLLKGIFGGRAFMG